MHILLNYLRSLTLSQTGLHRGTGCSFNGCTTINILILLPELTLKEKKVCVQTEPKDDLPKEVR